MIISTEWVTRRSWSYLRRRKSEHLHDLLHFQINENTSVDNIFLSFKLFLPHCLVSLFLHFCLLRHFEMIRHIAKSLISTSTHFLFKYNWKKKTWSIFVGQSFESQTGIPVLQTPWHICIVFSPSQYILKKQNFDKGASTNTCYIFQPNMYANIPLPPFSLTFKS